MIQTRYLAICGKCGNWTAETPGTKETQEQARAEGWAVAGMACFCPKHAEEINKAILTLAFGTKLLPVYVYGYRITFETEHAIKSPGDFYARTKRIEIHREKKYDRETGEYRYSVTIPAKHSDFRLSKEDRREIRKVAKFLWGEE